MSNSPVKISVVMSVYNGTLYLKESIDSILNQTFTDFEFIIIDDASTDNTWEILTDHANKDSRIQLFKNEENLGLTKSLNKGLKLAQGEYIARQDADDISLPERFEKQLKCLNENPRAVLVSCEVQRIDTKGNPLGQTSRATDPDTVAWYLLFHNYIGGHSQVMFRREPVMSLGGYSEDVRYSQDYNLWSRLVKLGDFLILPDILFKYRCGHDESISVKSGSEQKDYSLTTTRHNISQLLGEELTIKEATELRCFWLIGLRERFSEIRRFDLINNKLKKIYQAFLQQRKKPDSFVSETDMSRQLRFLIGRQFIWWLGCLEHRPISKLNIFYYALNWDSAQALSFALNKLRKALFHLPERK